MEIIFDIPHLLDHACPSTDNPVDEWNEYVISTHCYTYTVIAKKLSNDPSTWAVSDKSTVGEY